MSGLSAALRLAASGWQVTVVDKGRHYGGRMATRRFAGAAADHGAQFFTVRDERFERAVAHWVRAGVARPWFTDGGHTRYCATGGMNQLAEWLARGLDVRLGTHVLALQPAWTAQCESGESFTASHLLLTAPAPQSLALTAGLVDSATSAALQQIRFDPCLALIAVLDGPSRVPAPGYVRPAGGPLSWVADNQQKGVSPRRTAVTMHATAAISTEWWEQPREECARRMLEAAAEWLPVPPVEWQLHRWRYSQPVEVAAEPCLYVDAPGPIAFAGDAFAGPRLEGAFLSGLAAAERFIHAAN